MDIPETEKLFYGVRTFIWKSGHLADVKAMKYINKLMNKLKHKNQWLHRDEDHVMNLKKLLKITYEKLGDEYKVTVHDEYKEHLNFLESFRKFIRQHEVKQEGSDRYSIYILAWQDDVNGPVYDVAYGFVVIAKTEAEARELCSNDAGDESSEYKDMSGSHPARPDFWTNAKYTSCLRIGVSLTTKPNILMREYHNG
jgi:hypothetical protein